MNKLPPRHQLVQTDDGSATLFSESFQEACHSMSGAKAETLLHYIQGCRIEKRLRDHSPFVILEVGFGLGLGFLTTLETLKTCNQPWHFISLEIDRDLVEWFKDEHRNHPELKNLLWIDSNVMEVKTDSFTLTIVTEDARKSLPHYLSKNNVQWHAIYQDAFSPRRNPVLWTKEWFTLLKKHSHQDVVLSTYSASSSIRKSLHEAGWMVTKGDKFGPKRSSTRAMLVGESDPEILIHLSRSPVSALTDDNLEDFLRK